MWFFLPQLVKVAHLPRTNVFSESWPRTVGFFASNAWRGIFFSSQAGGVDSKKTENTCCPTYNSDRKIQKHKIRRIDFQTNRNSSNAFIAHRGDYFFSKKCPVLSMFFIQLKMFQSNDLLQEISHDFLFTQKLFKLHVFPRFLASHPCTLVSREPSPVDVASKGRNSSVFLFEETSKDKNVHIPCRRQFFLFSGPGNEFSKFPKYRQSGLFNVKIYIYTNTQIYIYTYIHRYSGTLQKTTKKNKICRNPCKYMY